MRRAKSGLFPLRSDKRRWRPSRAERIMLSTTVDNLKSSCRVLSWVVGFHAVCGMRSAVARSQPAAEATARRLSRNDSSTTLSRVMM